MNCPGEGETDLEAIVAASDGADSSDPRDTGDPGDTVASADSIARAAGAASVGTGEATFRLGDADDCGGTTGGTTGTVLVRLQKVLADAGVASRRAAEQLIVDGRVEVDGQIADRLGTRIDPRSASVRVDGRRVEVRAGLVHLALNKPRGVLSAMSDDRGRPTVGDHIPVQYGRLFHVGRLDADTEGLLLLTNDGELAHRLMHPSFGVTKTYLAEVTGTVARSLGRQLAAGVVLDDGPARVDAFRIVQREPGRTVVELSLHEGRNRIVRRLLAAVGHPVQRLVRTAIGPLVLGGQRVGTTRELSGQELTSLYEAIDLSTNR